MGFNNFMGVPPWIGLVGLLGRCLIQTGHDSQRCTISLFIFGQKNFSLAASFVFLTPACEMCNCCSKVDRALCGTTTCSSLTKTSVLYWSSSKVSWSHTFLNGLAKWLELKSSGLFPVRKASSRALYSESVFAQVKILFKEGSCLISWARRTESYSEHCAWKCEGEKTGNLLRASAIKWVFPADHSTEKTYEASFSRILINLGLGMSSNLFFQIPYKGLWSVMTVKCEHPRKKKSHFSMAYWMDKASNSVVE